MTERSSLARRNLPPIRRPPHGEKPLLFAGLHGMKRPEARREESLAGAMQLSAVPDRRVRDFLPCPIAASATFGRLAARRHLHTRPSLGDAGIRNDACRPPGHPGPGHPGPGHTGRAHRPGTPAGHTGRAHRPTTPARPHRPGHAGPATGRPRTLRGARDHPLRDRPLWDRRCPARPDAGSALLDETATRCLARPSLPSSPRPPARHKESETSQTFHAEKSNPLTGAGDNPPALWSSAAAFAKSIYYRTRNRRAEGRWPRPVPQGR
jgi:hypothetical protein